MLSWKFCHYYFKYGLTKIPDSFLLSGMIWNFYYNNLCWKRLLHVPGIRLTGQKQDRNYVPGLLIL